MVQENRRERRTKEKNKRRGSGAEDETTDLEDSNNTLIETHPASPFSTDALDYWKCRLMSRDCTYNDRIAQRISEMYNRLQLKMRDQVFDAPDPLLYWYF